MGQHVGDLVADDGGQLVLVGGDVEQAGVDPHVAARQGKGVGVLGLEHLDLPVLIALVFRQRLDHVAGHALHVLELAPAHGGQLLLVLVEGLGPHLAELLFVQQQHLGATSG